MTTTSHESACSGNSMVTLRTAARTHCTVNLLPPTIFTMAPILFIRPSANDAFGKSFDLAIWIVGLLAASLLIWISILALVDFLFNRSPHRLPSIIGSALLASSTWAFLFRIIFAVLDNTQLILYNDMHLFFDSIWTLLFTTAFVAPASVICSPFVLIAYLAGAITNRMWILTYIVAATSIDYIRLAVLDVNIF